MCERKERKSTRATMAETEIRDVAFREQLHGYRYSAVGEIK